MKIGLCLKVFGICTLLIGCDYGKVDWEYSSEDWRYVPEELQKLSATSFPAGRDIHVIHAKGMFVANSKTSLCDIVIDGSIYEGSLKHYIKETQRRTGFGKIPIFSHDAVVWSDDTECKAKNAIFSKYIEMPNRNGDPYKLIHIYWQGDVTKGGAYWIGGVEQLYPASDPRYQHTPVPDDDVGAPQEYSSAEMEMILSRLRTYKKDC